MARFNLFIDLNKTQILVYFSNRESKNYSVLQFDHPKKIVHNSDDTLMTNMDKYKQI